jgi:hypothetical protein
MSKNKMEENGKKAAEIVSNFFKEANKKLDEGLDNIYKKYPYLDK